MRYKLIILHVAFFFLTIGNEVEAQRVVRNPILSGFHPDPCIVRVANDYYITTSTFEWFPGIPIYHSTDLENWEQLGHVLTRKSQLDITGTSDSNGIFAPSISYHNGKFYVMYTIVREGVNWAMKGYPNYIVTATDPSGPWSEPTLINSLGFDPSLFIDDDGRAYVLVRLFDHRTGKSMSPGIGIHELDINTLEPIGEVKFVYSGWNKQSAEGPKMHKKDGYYYLFTAEGGTGYGHYEGVARSKSIWGPYERAPKIFYSAKDNPDLPAQKIGHGTIFNTPTGEWFTTHLGSRPLSKHGNCSLGRETFIQNVEWTKDGWPQLKGGTIEPKMEFLVNNTSNIKKDKSSKTSRDEFNSPILDKKYQFLREPADDTWLSLSRKEGSLSLRGRHTLGTLYQQSLIAQRVQSYHQTFETCIDFVPTNFRHSAGMTCYYNSKHFYSLGLTYDEDQQSIALEIIEVDKTYKELLNKRVSLKSGSKIFMRTSIDRATLRFFYSLDGQKWFQVGEDLNFGKISDDYAGGFTGAMVGLFAQDLLYENKWANFGNYSAPLQFFQTLHS